MTAMNGERHLGMAGNRTDFDNELLCVLFCDLDSYKTDSNNDTTLASSVNNPSCFAVRVTAVFERPIDNNDSDNKDNDIDEQIQ